MHNSNYKYKIISLGNDRFRRQQLSIVTAKFTSLECNIQLRFELVKPKKVYLYKLKCKHDEHIYHWQIKFVISQLLRQVSQTTCYCKKNMIDAILPNEHNYRETSNDGSEKNEK